MTVLRGREFLNTPGPTNIPVRVLNAMNKPAVDFSTEAFQNMARSCFDDLKKVMGTKGELFTYVANGHGAWEAALANTLSPGDTILIPETGQFSEAWRSMAKALQLECLTIPNDWTKAIDIDGLADILAKDKQHKIKAVLAVQVDTASSILSDIPAVRAAIDACQHPALLMVDVIASLTTTPFEMDGWGVDIGLAASQKGLMLPIGASFTTVSEKAIAAAKKSTMPRRYWDWHDRMQQGEFYRRFCGTPPIHLLWGLRESLDMILEETVEGVIRRHAKLAQAVRAAVAHWGQNGSLSFQAAIAEQRADSVTAVRVAGIDAELIRRHARNKFSLSLGGGLGPLQGKVFRIGHLGDNNEPMILGSLGALELTMRDLGLAIVEGGVSAAVGAMLAFDQQKAMAAE